MKKKFEGLQGKCREIVDYVMGYPCLQGGEDYAVKFRLCVEEAVDNVINYAYNGSDGWLEVEIGINPTISSLIFRLRDAGVKFNPLSVSAPDMSVPVEKRNVGGLGIFFFKKIMDEIEYSYEDGCNVLTMTKHMSTYPLSQSQMGIFFSCQNSEDNYTNFQIPFLYRLPSSVDTDRLKSALEEFIKAHPYILSHITLSGDAPVMQPGEFKEVPIIKKSSIDDPSCGFGKTMKLLEDDLFRIEIYQTDSGNYLYTDFHHIIYDGSSLNVFTEEIKNAYLGNALQKEEYDAGTVSEEEAALRKSDEWKNQQSWYLEEFSGAQELDSKPVPSVAAAQRKGFVEREFPLYVTGSTISSICKRNNVGKSIVFTAAWGKMLANYTAEDKAYFSSIFHGRMDARFSRIISMMVRTIPVYMEMPSYMPIGEWLGRLSEQQSAVRQKSVYSISDLNKDMQSEGSTIFAYQGKLALPSDFPLQLGDDKVACKDLRTPRPGTTLDAQLFDTPDGYLLKLAYDKSLYSDEMIDGMAESFNAILESMAVAETISDLKAVTQKQLSWLDARNPSELPRTDLDMTVAETFVDNAIKHPDNVCCVFEDRKYSYAQIEAISSHLAAKIQQSIVREGPEIPVVSFISPRDEWMVIMPLAITRAGCTYQPLDPSYPAERLSFMVSDSRAALLMCTPEYSETIEFPEDRKLIVKYPEDFVSGESPAPLKWEGNDTFILLYTSGTTGTPKGVAMSQKNIAAICRYNIRNMEITAESRYASYASYGFDAFMLDLWGTLTAGASIHIISEEIRFNLDEIKNYFEREGITHTLMTTQVGTQMAINYPDIPGFKSLMVGGEKLVSIDPPKYRLINGYGPTESTAYITSYVVTSNEPNIPIGHPTENAHIYIVNKDGKRVPMGAAGELWTSGTQTAKEYINQKEKTAAAFIPNPFVSEEEKEVFPTVYRTGDIVRYREDGELEFVGRKDGQVKIRGFRIELKEVEGVIREFPGISEVTVQAFEQEDGGKYIAAYVVSDSKVDTKGLADFIRDRKPPYMVPAVTMQLDSIPLNVNGKVDKKQLPKPVRESSAQSKGQEAAAPLNRLEQELSDMVCRLTDCSDFGITTPLAYAGLTSISSLKLSVQLLKKYGISVSVKELATSATLQSLENMILEKFLSKSPEEDNAGEEKTSSPVASAVHSAPLTSAQLGVYYECLKNNGSTVYNIPFAVTFPEVVSAEEIKRATEIAIAAHPIMFARIDSSSEPPMQTYSAGAVPEVTVSDKNPEDLRKGFVRPFDLERGPLYRATVSGNVLLLDVHHLVMDGSSVSILIHQICDALDGKMVPKEDFNYFDFAEREKNADLSGDEKFFETGLSRIDEAVSIPADLHEDEHKGRQAEVTREINHEKVSSFAKALGKTPAAVYLSALQYVAARYGNTEDICLCTVSSGRSDLSITGTVGMFVNTLALVSHIGDESAREYIGGTADMLSKTLEHEKYPFARVADKFGISPQIMFIYQVGLIDNFSVHSGPVEMESMELSAPKCKFSLLVEERNGKVCLTAQYNDALYSPEMMRRLLESLEQTVLNMIEAPDSPLRKLSLVSSAQQKELDGMHSVGTIPIPISLFHKGIEQWASLTPDKTAVMATDATLSYKELNSNANRIANALLAKGLSREDAVVVLLPRRSSTVCCMLGIMKAGGAFITCDPEYPAERIKLIAEDSGAPYVVTTADKLEAYGSRGICIDELETWSNDTDPALDIAPENAAYMIYTSGSTGRPKGVCVEHRNITTCLTADETHPLWPLAHDCERLCSVATISFDAFIFDFGQSLFHGHTLVFSSETEAKDPVALTALLKRSKADYFCGTSSRILQYLELPEFEECIRNCRVIIQGGEKYSEILLEKLRKINPAAALLNGYGPTEISISCNTGDLQKARSITVGKPQPNYTEWILDRDGNELPVGVTGELCVGGRGVTRGYNNLPEKTAEKYITYNGMRAFKTGDYARWTEDGDVVILGRTDNQVKLRGLRIELGEVESAISKVEGVKNVLVKICSIKGRDHLCAYFSADRDIPVEEMKSSISGTLTAYMVPDAYLQMDSLPTTPNGKIDFRHLPEPVLAKSDSDYVAPCGKDEQFFADTFARILGLDKVGATESFFDLGGTSLVVMKVVINSQKAGYQITYSDVFENPTPRQLAKLACANQEQEVDPDGDIKDYDYSGIDTALKSNTLDSFTGNPELRPLGTVLLTGATGFLGIHVFDCLLRNYPDSEIHCLLRSRKGITAEERLRQLMFYYFERDFSDQLGKRVFVHEGDVTAPLSIDAQIDTVINCAALVKHFSKGSEIEDVNVGGVRNCIDFCLNKAARLVQISTYSVAGMSVNGMPDIKAFDESMLYLGQRIRNQYVHSKIIGERMILEAVSTKGLDAKIMRVGNLSARSQDGEFQINAKANSFMGRLKIYQMLGALPYSAYMSPIEFSPIDQTAEAICLLSRTNQSCTVFHPYNSHYQMLGDILRQMETIGKDIRLVEDNVFLDILNKAKEDESTQEKLSAMLAYETKPNDNFVQVIGPDNSFTIQVLLRLGFRWDMTSWDYIDQFLRQINGLKFFDGIK